MDFNTVYYDNSTKLPFGRNRPIIEMQALLVTMRVAPLIVAEDEK